MKPKPSARINLLLLFIIVCILFFLHFRKVQREMFHSESTEMNQESRP
ncbi:MAG: hypothetical protein JXR87_07790 [Candidatus Marinimicrobia bacterium]|nr:hypothetical protein [Candidatus Neomarinimicrobiota bacterium]